MKKFIEKFNSLDKSIKRTILGGIIVIVLLTFIVIVVGVMNNKKLSYSRLEQKIKTAAISYYEDYPEKLPHENGQETKLDSKVLITDGYLKELSKYSDDACVAEVYVMKNNDEYTYIPYLACQKYKTVSLTSHISNEQEIVTSGDGLYRYNSEMIYRGENINNYINFSGKLWRILRIMEEGEIRVIQAKSSTKFNWDDRYNIDLDNYSGINNFEVSRMKDWLIETANDADFIQPDLRKWIIAKNICLDKKDSIDFNNLSNINCLTYSQEKYQFSLISLEEYFIASLDKNCNNIKSESCTNYNYLATGKYWTITPSAKSSNKVYTTGGSTTASQTDKSYNVRIVMNLSKHVLYGGGDGSRENPYIIK